MGWLAVITGLIKLASVVAQWASDRQLIKAGEAQAVAAGAAVINQPASWFQLTSDDAGDNEVEVGQAVNYTLEFVEDLR